MTYLTTNMNHLVCNNAVNTSTIPKHKGSITYTQYIPSDTEVSTNRSFPLIPAFTTLYPEVSATRTDIKEATCIPHLSATVIYNCGVCRFMSAASASVIKSI